jgi:hypothetical protein
MYILFIGTRVVCMHPCTHTMRYMHACTSIRGQTHATYTGGYGDHHTPTHVVMHTFKNGHLLHEDIHGAGKWSHIFPAKHAHDIIINMMIVLHVSFKAFFIITLYSKHIFHTDRLEQTYKNTPLLEIMRWHAARGMAFRACTSRARTQWCTCVHVLVTSS